jgi:hypothetical protein
MINPNQHDDTLDVININFLSTLATLIITITLASILIELEIAVSIALLAICIGLVDLRTLWEFTVSLQGTGLVGAVLQDNVAFLVLVVAEREEDDITLVDPDLLAELATDVCETFRTVEAERFEATVAEHLQDLRILCGELV